MDLDWCLICERKTQGALYCSEECRFKDYLSAYNYLTPSSPTSSGASTPTDSGSSTSNASISTNNSFAYLFYRKPSPCFQRPQRPSITNPDHFKNNMAICDLLPEIKKSQPALNPAFKNTIEMSKNSNANLACSLDTRHLHI